MHIIGKKYRVVCSQTQDKHLYIDIVPADNALHRLILKERVLQNDGAEIIAGSVKLYDMGEGCKPEILFLPSENGGLEAVELSAAEENRLRYKITAKFNEMLAQNKQSTLNVRPEIHQEYAMEIINGITSKLDASLKTYDAPQSPQEEQNKLFIERRNQAARTREQTQEYLRRRDEKYGKHGVSALQIKQLIYRDY